MGETLTVRCDLCKGDFGKASGLDAQFKMIEFRGNRYTDVAGSGDNQVFFKKLHKGCWQIFLDRLEDWGNRISRIFVDVDDTLVLYESDVPINPYGIYQGLNWKPNLDLIGHLYNATVKDPLVSIIVWSGGGKSYAEMWIEKLGIEDLVTVGLTKTETNFRYIGFDSLVIDDGRLEGRRTHAPDDFSWVKDFRL